MRSRSIRKEWHMLGGYSRRMHFRPVTHSGVNVGLTRARAADHWVGSQVCVDSVAIHVEDDQVYVDYFARHVEADAAEHAHAPGNWRLHRGGGC